MSFYTQQPNIQPDLYNWTYEQVSTPPYLCQTIPPDDEWRHANYPASNFEPTLLPKCALSVSPSAPIYDAPYASTQPRKKRAPRKGTPPDRIPRPPNAFIIFRSKLAASIPNSVQNDQKRNSRSAGKIWASLSDEQRREYEKEADLAKAEHQILHPHYRFKPVKRSKPIVRRKVKGSAPEDKARDEGVAKLLLAGNNGDALVRAVMAYDGATVESDPPLSPPQPLPAASPSILTIPEAPGWPPQVEHPSSAVPDLDSQINLLDYGLLFAPRQSDFPFTLSENVSLPPWQCQSALSLQNSELYDSSLLF